MSKQFEENVAAGLVLVFLFLPAFGITGDLPFPLRASLLTGVVVLAAWGAAGSRKRRAGMLAALRWVFLLGSLVLVWRAGAWLGMVSIRLALPGRFGACVSSGFLFLLVCPFGRSFWLGWFNARFPETTPTAERRVDVRMEDFQSVHHDFAG
jgi:hypothetical protein